MNSTLSLDHSQDAICSANIIPWACLRLEICLFPFFKTCQEVFGSSGPPETIKLVNQQLWITQRASVFIATVSLHWSGTGRWSEQHWWSLHRGTRDIYIFVSRIWPKFDVIEAGKSGKIPTRVVKGRSYGQCAAASMGQGSSTSMGIKGWPEWFEPTEKLL